MSEQNESGNRWEKPVETDDETTTQAAEASPAVEPVETPAAGVPAEATPVEPAVKSKMPGWVTRTRLIATGAAAAIFLGGGAVGYAVGNAGDDDHGRFPDRFDRVGFEPGQGPDGQFPGGQGPGGQGPGGQQGQSQVPQGQSSSGSDSGTAS